MQEIKKKILVVDDEKEQIDMLSRVLEKRGYQVLSATSGEQAIGKAKKELPDLILLDIMMPGLDGIEVSNILKEDLSTSKIPIAFVTGLLSPQEQSEKGKVISGNIIIAKPYDLEELISVVEKMLNLS